jgi:CheY-like chemotaxis protein
VSRRELAVDVAYTLEPFAGVSAVYALEAAPQADAFRFGVELRPFSFDELAAAHCAVLEATDYEVTGRMLYFAPDLRPPFVDKAGQRVRIADGERFAARRRAQMRATDPSRAERRREELERMRRALADMEEADRVRACIAASLVTGILEVVCDPFPSRRLPSRRVLVVDADDSTAATLVDLGASAEVIAVRDGWTALDRIAAQRFDLVICAVDLEDVSSRQLYRMAVAERPELAARFVLLASPASIGALPPASARGRVLARPVSADVIRKLLW